MTEISIKRVYEPAESKDGFRILVDRIWPRGESKEKAEIDLWNKDTAPSTELRKWFGHTPERWKEFATRYKMELDQNTVAVNELAKEIKKHKTVTLVFAAKDVEHSHAQILKKYLEERI